MEREEKLSKWKEKKNFHQGCPLTPYLYLFVANVLGYMVSDRSYKIKGLILPDGRQVWDQMFANDTIFFF
jgi:hypothetical protein